jgi:hypothetical protein
MCGVSCSRRQLLEMFLMREGAWLGYQQWYSRGEGLCSSHKKSMRQGSDDVVGSQVGAAIGDLSLTEQDMRDCMDGVSCSCCLLW